MTIEDPSYRNEGAGRGKRLVTTRAGITIGIRAEPPKPKLSDDAERLQAVLLTSPISGPWYVRMWRAFLAWLG